ncbi:MAG: acyl-CoA dehydrogenase family protein [Gammaproteobacteria bacterium]|nr:acyl-CoA dehydrogenase family protein [Gammaproteobacteria bacterium]
MKDILMLDTLFSSEELMIRDAVRRFVTEVAEPLLAPANESAHFPHELIAKMAALGIFGMRLPESVGGSNASAYSYGLVCQELERGDSALRSFASVQSSLCMYPIYRFGSEEQQQKWLPCMAKGEVIGCFGLTEPDSGSDPSSMKTHAKRSNNGWVLNGSKMWITNAPLAHLALIWAHTSDGIRGFLVETDREGIACSEMKHKFSLRASSTGEISLNDCWIPEENMLPGTEKGLSCALSCLNQARFGISWGVIGAAESCFDTASNYLAERNQFAKPLASYQLIQKDLVDIYNEIIKAKCLNIQLGRLMNVGEATPEMISLAKMNNCREALRIARMARNLMGANGISTEYPVMRHVVNLESVFTYEGTDNIHHLILGKYLTGIDAFS